MQLTAPGQNFYNRTARYRENLLSVIEYEGFPSKFPSDYNWLVRQRGLKKNGELNSEYKSILDTYLPGWDDDTYTMLTNARRIRIMEIATHGNPDLGVLMENTSVDAAYILAKFGIGNVAHATNIPANFMFLKSTRYSDMTNYVFQRSVAGDTKVAKLIQDAVFTLIKKQYPSLTKETLAASWFINENNSVLKYMGYNLYLFNFTTIRASFDYGSCDVTHNLTDEKKKVIISFANRYRNTLIKLCDCFMDKKQYMEIIKTSEFKKMYDEVYKYNFEDLNRWSASVPHSVDEKKQKQLKLEKEPVRTKGILGLMNMFKRDRSPEYDPSKDIISKKLKPKGPSGNGYIASPGDEYNSGYVGSSSGGHEGHSFGEYVAAAAAIGAIDFDGDDGDDGGDFDD